MREEGLRTVRRDPWSSSACLGTGCIEAGYMVGFGGTKEQSAQRSPVFPLLERGAFVLFRMGKVPSLLSFLPCTYPRIHRRMPPFLRAREGFRVPFGTDPPFVPIPRVRNVPHSKDLPSKGIGIDPHPRVDSFPPKGTSPTPTPTPFPFSPTIPRKAYE